MVCTSIRVPQVGLLLTPGPTPDSSPNIELGPNIELDSNLNFIADLFEQKLEHPLLFSLLSCSI